MKLHSGCFLQNLVPCVSLKLECNNSIEPLDVSIPSEIPIQCPTPIYRNARFDHSVCFCVSISAALLLHPQITGSPWSAHRASSSSTVFRFTPSLFDYELLPVQRVPSVVIKDSWAVLLWKKQMQRGKWGRTESGTTQNCCIDWSLQAFERQDWGRTPHGHQRGELFLSIRPWGGRLFRQFLKSKAEIETQKAINPSQRLLVDG